MASNQLHPYWNLLLNGVLRLLAASWSIPLGWEEDSPTLLTAEAWLSLQRTLADEIVFSKSRLLCVPGFWVSWLPLVSSAGPARPVLLLFLMTGNVCSHPSSLSFSHPPHPPTPASGSQLALITSGSSCFRLQWDPVSTPLGWFMWFLFLVSLPCLPS